MKDGLARCCLGKADPRRKMLYCHHWLCLNRSSSDEFRRSGKLSCGE